MTISDIYARLYSRAYYEKTGQHKFRFSDNALLLDRRATIPIAIHMLDGVFYLQVSKQIANESLFRLEMTEEEIMLYSTNSDSPLWILE